MGTNFLSTDWVLDDDAAFFLGEKGVDASILFLSLFGVGRTVRRRY